MAMSSNQEADAVMGDINMTPMVDVLLVLLIIFMIVTPALLTGFTATLPQALNLIDRADEPENTVLGIDNKGAYYLNKQPIELGTLEGALRAEMQKHSAADEAQIMFGKADKGVKWSVIDAALVIAREAEVPMAALINDPAPDPNGSKAGGE
jgi:biopolymer transport protein ExbD